MKIGYARVSTADQGAGLEAQERDLLAAGCEKVFAEKISGSRADRPKLAEALAFMREGDTLVVTKPDRLARSTADLLNFVKDIKARECALVVLSMAGQPLDTSNPTSTLMLTVLAAVAQFERELMLERQREGILAAKAQGRVSGRPRKLAALVPQILSLQAEGVSGPEIARRLGCSRAGMYAALKAHAAS